MNVDGSSSVEGAVLRSAQALAARGWFVFPCAPGGKRPAMRGNWQRLATADPVQVHVWWSRAPYNIGIACGPSGLVVVDLDVPRGARPRELAASSAPGTDALAALCEQHGQPNPLPTYAVGTPSGGCHLYYAARPGRIRNSVRRLGPFIDIRADGGYVVGEGSRIDGRDYTAWDRRPPMRLPAWMTTLLRDNPVSRTPGRLPAVPGCRHRAAYAIAALRDETRRVAAARPGTRNDTLNRAAFNLGQLAAAGLLPSAAVVTALASAAERAGLPENETRRTIRSGITAGARYPRKDL